MMYQTLGIRDKIKDDGLRLLYLKEVWGLPQLLMAECEGLSQSKVSRNLKAARKHFGEINVKDETLLDFTPEEIKQLQEYPTDILSDVQLVTFVHHVLDLEVHHLLYTMMTRNVKFRIPALCSLGIQQIRVAELLNRTQASVSQMMKVRRDATGEMLNSSFRLDINGKLVIVPKVRDIFRKKSSKFYVANQ